jgi:DNA repair exonuclease SbcCD nuclease subunit
MLTEAIERLRQVAPVDVVVVPGNHDTLSTWHMGDSLECLFSKCEDVSIDNAPLMRKYYEFGKVMLLLTHGNKGKLADYPLAMAAEKPEMWGRTKHREAHTGDKHQLKVHELHGVKVRITPALCPPDAWHSESLFVGNPRSAEAFIWHKDEGLVGTATYTVPER